MNDDEFDDLFAEAHLLEYSSQESLIDAASNFNVDDNVPQLSGASGNSSIIYTCSQCRNLSDSTEISRSSECSVHCQSVDVDNVASGSTEQSRESNHTTQLSVIEQIEQVFEHVVDGMFDDKDDLEITLKARHDSARSDTDPTAHRPSRTRRPRTRILRFPGKSAEEAWRFSVVLRILELMHEALRNDVVLSKRDIYYRDPALFGSQSHVDRYVDDIARTFGVPRANLNVAAAAKGLVAGALTFCRRDGSSISAAEDREGILVPTLRNVLCVNMPAVRWIIVIEKEASFRSIAASPFWNEVRREGVILTGKGYPDIATRALLRFLSTCSPQNGFVTPRVYGLVDFDPDGLAILSTYKHGSLALAHENGSLRVPQLKWLGLCSEHVMLGGNDQHPSQGLLPLTARDRRMASKMLRREALSSERDDELRKALQVMVMLNTKAELQLMDALPNAVRDVLTSVIDGTADSDSVEKSH